MFSWQKHIFLIVLILLTTGGFDIRDIQKVEHVKESSWFPWIGMTYYLLEMLLGWMMDDTYDFFWSWLYDCRQVFTACLAWSSNFIHQAWYRCDFKFEQFVLPLINFLNLTSTHRTTEGWIGENKVVNLLVYISYHIGRIVSKFGNYADGLWSWCV